MHMYTPINKLRVINGLFHMCYSGSFLWSNLDKISPSLKEVENKAFPSKFWHVKCLFLSFAKIAILLNFQRIVFYHFH